MKITCSNCQKKYTFDDAKLAPGITSARCTACGQLIPLSKALAKTPAKPALIVSVSCLYCGRRHRLRQDKIPPTAVSIKCKSCARPVPLSREEKRSAPVHPLKTESASPGGKQFPGKPAVPPENKNDQIRLACDGCGKKYKISRTKIPPNTGQVSCKACGHQIQLPRAAPGNMAHERDRAHHPGPAELTPETRPADSRSGKKKWRVAAAACILLVLVLGTLVHFNMVKSDWLKPIWPWAAEKAADSTPLADNEPFLALTLNMPLIINAVENRLESPDKTSRLQKMVSLIQSINLSRLELYLYSTPNNQVLPVVLASGGDRRQLEGLLNRQEPFSRYFERKPDGRYRLKTEAFENKEAYQLPAEPYEVTLTDTGAVLAPVSKSKVILQNPHLITGASIVKFAQAIEKNNNLAAIAIRLPDRFSQGWQKKILEHPLVQSTPQAATVADMGTAIISRLAGSLKPVDVLALGFRFSGQNKRSLSYAQQFRPDVNGKKIYRQLAAANPADTEINGIIKNLIELFQDTRYQHTLGFKDNRLTLEFSWSEKEDGAFLTALTAATVGQLFAGSMALSPTPGEVETLYATEPIIVTAVDAEQLKTNAPQMIKDGLFPGQYWDMGEEPRMTLDLDQVNLPNSAMAELDYDVRSVLSSEGKDVVRMEENKLNRRIQPGRLYPGNILLNVKKGTLPDELAQARIKFRLAVPVALEVIDFSAEDAPGLVKQSGAISVTLNQLEKDVAKVSSSGDKSMRLIAYDQTGRALASRETMSTPASAATRFEGLIKKLKVAVSREILEYAFEVEVDLNRGRPLALSREPEIPARMRYDHHPVLDYANFSPDDLKNLAVAWNEGQERAWNDSLSIALPQRPFSGYADWEVHFFGKNRHRFLAGNSAQDSASVSFSLDKDKLKQASAAFGKVELGLHTDILRLVFVKPDGGPEASQSLPSGATVSIAFDKNEISYSAGNADVIQTAAFDARGKRLKQDPYRRNRDGQRSIYFWGVPAKFIIDVSTQKIRKLIPFDIKKRPVDEKAYIAYKQTVENQRAVVNTIKTIDRARRKDRSYYGDDLAGLYYLHDNKQKTPLNLIRREIAHSDPAGQKRFGYEVRPYKGYYFTVLFGVESNGTKKDYNRRSKKSRFSWQQGTFTATALTRHPDLVAIPEDDAQPTFFLQWGQVYTKPLNGGRLTYLPEGYYNEGWVEAKFIEP